MARTTLDEGSANERSYRHVRQGILTGRFPGGTMLSEATLAAELAVSRTPVRAALVRLQEEGWVTIYPKRGALVQTLSDRAVRELAEAKAMLESGAVRAARPRALTALAVEMRPDLLRQQEVLDAGDLTAFVELSIAFHRSFIAAAGNEVVLELYDRLADRQRFLLFSYGRRLLDRAAAIVEEHGLLLDAAASGDGDAFAATLRDHLTKSYGDATDPRSS
ncbi:MULTISPECIES: GntR family transcriptional regulator [Saccharopolyspora]|uniref:GntR family transcriptional regulator n=1 Tax=Saccharopolyspora TaxID=1835 RepID=UPI001CD21CEA|nr:MULTISPECIES: GntR family transcriptional regulator [Saccharopolyspora]MCA1190672.1 GntR family transcriptional regulator [Saccharopolyspora sp. 6V]